MRYVKRNVDGPSILYQADALNYLKRVEQFIASGVRNERAPRPPHHILSSSSLKADLSQIFLHKCAFCERKVGLEESSTVTHFRPISDAENRGRVEFLNYCWLALEWENLYFSCATCAKAKRNTFPVGISGEILSPIQKLRVDEEAVLIDPCFDNPFDHISIDENGSLFGYDDRGASTIWELQLNRYELQRDRKKVFDIISGAVTRGSHSAYYDTSAETLVTLTADDVEYSGIARMVSLRYLPESNPLRKGIERGFTSSSVKKFLSVVRKNPNLQPENRYLPSQPLDSNIPKPRGTLRRIKIRNFKGIRSLDVDFPKAGASSLFRESATAILGDNGTGKTSLLQAIALAAMGPERARKYVRNPSEILSNEAESGEIIAYFWETESINRIDFSAARPRLTGAHEVEVTVLGYGAHRRASARATTKYKSEYIARTSTLFNRNAVIDGAKGLSRRFRANYRDVGQEIWDAARILTNVLSGTAEAKPGKRNALEIIHNGQTVQIGRLSSGFESVVAVVCDVMDAMYETSKALTYAPALILIDEIDAHLHPTWRMKIVEVLRDTFSQAQIIVTTHDPLILRGFEEWEVRVLEKSSEALRADEPRISSVQGLSIDQLLTSELFDLKSTTSEEINAMFKEYYRLLALSARRSRGEDGRSADAQSDVEVEISNLEEKLRKHDVLGTTRREQILYKVIDTYLAIETERREWMPEEVLRLLSAFGR